MEQLNKDWQDYVIDKYDYDGLEDDIKEELEIMLTIHINALKEEVSRASQNGNNHIYDTTRGYVAGLQKAISLIKQSKPNE